MLTLFHVLLLLCLWMGKCDTINDDTNTDDTTTDDSTNDVDTIDTNDDRNVVIKEIEFCQIGLNSVGILTMLYGIKKGYKLTSVFTNETEYFDKDISKVININNDNSEYGIKIKNIKYLDKTLDRTKPDICIDTTKGELTDIYVNSRRILSKGINLITINNEMIYPNSAFNWKAPPLIDSLNETAKEYGVTMFGSGISDGIIYPIITSASSFLLNIKDIYVSIFDFADLGELIGIGMNDEQFNDNKIAISNPAESIGLMCRCNVELIANELGLTLKTTDGDIKSLYTRVTCYKIDGNYDVIHSEVLNRDVKKDECIGLNITAKGETNEGPIIYFNFVLGLENEFLSNEPSFRALFTGEPSNFEINIPLLNYIEFDALSVVNRVPQIIDMIPGFYKSNDINQPNSFVYLPQNNNKPINTDDNKQCSSNDNDCN